MRISIAQKRGLISVYSADLDMRVVEKIREEEILGKRYYGSMYAVRRAIALCKPILEEIQPDDIVLFEVSSLTVVSWLENNEANKGYEVYFDQLLEELNMLPIRYKFVHSEDSSAVRFMDEYDGKVKLSGMESLLDA